jgi:two-component system, NarL family, nitrate/nitrite response regulator NarL
MSLPIVVTHPSTLFHNGLRQLFTKSRFRPVRIATSLNDELETYLRTQGSCIWLTGVETSIAATNTLVRKVVAANPGVKAVILAPAHNPENIVAALKAGAWGFLCQDICGERLLKSLDLIALSEMVVHPKVAWSPAANQNHTNSCAEGEDQCGTLSGAAHMIQSLQSRSGAACTNDEAGTGAGQGVPSLSRRETLILRMLVQGASNKIIARNLVITESTVKVHMKAILRKLRLQNRTQAAIWARNNVNENDWNIRAANAGAAH